MTNYIIQVTVLAGLAIMLTGVSASAQPANDKKVFTKQDTLRGSLNEHRTWWNVTHYNIAVTPHLSNETIEGFTTITFNVLAAANKMQIDLQEPLIIDSALLNFSAGRKKEKVPFEKNGNTWLLNLPSLPSGASAQLTIYYHGRPRKAMNAPWDGGWIWEKDSANNHWVSVACQQLGASVWYPCKDHQSDEPDNGATLSITVPDSLHGIGNGRLKEKLNNNNGTTTWVWEVKSPINNYNIVPYIGKYSLFSETYKGEKGNLDCSYWVLTGNLEKAKQQFKQVRLMLQSFEHWFGPYPFYEDGFKLVEAPHLGMEHQGAVAYGNGYSNGYMGRDLSATGWGLKWDFIIVHESGHEWFANNITTNDIADMWVHESFTNYSESLFTQYHYGKEAGNDYVIGTRKLIENDEPIIGPYGVNRHGSGDMYYKGGNMLHTIRQVINDDEKFRQILRGLNKTFYHQTVTTQQVENYISAQSGIDFSKVFNQYLRTTKVPLLEVKLMKNKLQYRWNNCVKGFNMPVKINATKTYWLKPTQKWQTQTIPGITFKTLRVDRNFFIDVKTTSVAWVPASSLPGHQ